jgi:hypothetical protein
MSCTPVATPCGHTQATPSTPHAALLRPTRAMSGSLEWAELPSACVGTMFARILLACVPPAELRPTDSYPCGPSISESLPLSDRAEGRRAGRKRQRRGSARLHGIERRDGCCVLPSAHVRITGREAEAAYRGDNRVRSRSRITYSSSHCPLCTINLSDEIRAVSRNEVDQAESQRWFIDDRSPGPFVSTERCE